MPYTGFASELSFCLSLLSKLFFLLMKKATAAAMITTTRMTTPMTIPVVLSMPEGDEETTRNKHKQYNFSKTMKDMAHLLLILYLRDKLQCGHSRTLHSNFYPITRFSNSGFCHLGVNFFVFCRNLKTKTDLKSLCNFQIECGISKDLMIKFLPKIKKMLFFSVFDLIFLRVFSFFSVKNMSFLV